MTIEKKKLYSYTEVTTSELADKVPTLQGGVNKVTTLQKIYNLFKNSFDSVYTTTSAVATQISNALSGYATQNYANTAANNALTNANSYTTNVSQTLIHKQNKDFTIDIYADAVSHLITSNCILAIRDFPGTGDIRVRIKIEDGVLVFGDVIMTSLSHNDFNANLMAWHIADNFGVLYLDLYFNVVSVPSQPIFLYINKIN